MTLLDRILKDKLYWFRYSHISGGTPWAQTFGRDRFSKDKSQPRSSDDKLNDITTNNK